MTCGEFLMRKIVLYLQYTSPANYPPLEHSGLILLNAGWEVSFFGVQSEGESRELILPGPLAARQNLWSYQPSGLRQKLQFICFTVKALLMVLGRGTTWVYCSDLLSCPAAWLIGCLTRCRVLYHEHDSPEDGTWQPKASAAPAPVSPFQRFLLWTRRQVGRDADLVVLPNQVRLAAFVMHTRRSGSSFCVWNCPRQGDDRVRGGVVGNAGILRLAFHGSINGDRLPLTLLAAMKRFPGRIHLSVVGYETLGLTGYLAEFLQEADRLGVAAQVEFIGVLPARRELLDQVATCDVGLAFMPLRGGDINMTNMTGASNKPFDYLACELALLVSARSDWETMFVRPGFGLSCNPGDVNDMARQLQWFLDHPAETREMGRRGRRKILTDWNYESQFAPVLAGLACTI